MAVNKIGRGLIISGIAGIVLSILIPVLFNGQIDLRSIQIFSIEISAVVVLLGVWLARAEMNEENQTRGGFDQLATWALNLPLITWVFLGFLLVYVLLFLRAVFLHSSLQMQYFTGYIPNLIPIGNDLTVMVDLIKGWVAQSQSPYTIQFYPPLTYMIFTPLLLFKDPLPLYRFFTLFTFVSYCLLTLLLPLKIIDKKQLSLILLLFVTGLFSYGLQFELERGQYNVFTLLLCLTSIYIFHYQPRYRLLAYILFSLSVQLKLYPAIFIFMFVDDWRDWKRVVLRFLAIGLFNLLLFFVMGYQIFWDFIRSVTAQVLNPTWTGVWNHSIAGFVSTIKEDGLGLLSLETLRTFRRNPGWLETVLILAFLVLFLCALIIFYLRKKGGLDPYLLLTCTIGALILPISYDYTLSILTAPMLLFFCGIPEMNNQWYRLISILLTIGISIAYFFILAPYNYRPYFLSNSFPLLFLILILATFLNFLHYRDNQLQPTQS